LKNKLKEAANLQQCDLLVMMEPLKIMKEKMKVIKEDFQTFYNKLYETSEDKLYANESAFNQAFSTIFGSEVNRKYGIIKKLFNGCRGDNDFFAYASLQKLKASLDMYDFYHVMKRGEKEDNRELYKLMQTSQRSGN
jgi:hypothetical protein